MEMINQFITINSSKQSILTLSTNNSNPILLILHGGPGSPDRPLVCKYNCELANHFIVVCWDQRCSGLSYTKENKKEKLNINLMLSDLKELVIYLTQKYNQNKIYIAGHSWGAYLGLRFVKEYPQYVKYYIGTGQGISSLVDEIDKYNFVIQKAIEENDEKVINKLNFFGTPNGYNYQNDTANARKFVSKYVQKYGGYIYPNNDFSMNSYLPSYLKHYGIKILKVLAGVNYSVKHLNPEINMEDKISSITSLDVPILLISGEQDYVCPVPATKRWFENLRAPKKNFVIIKNAAHMVNFEKSAKWNNEIIKLLKNNK